MFCRSFLTQVKISINRKNAWFVFYALVATILTNYLIDVVKYKGSDIVEMLQSVKLLTLYENSGAPGFYFLQLYPLLVAIPAGFAYFEDRSSGTGVYIHMRSGATSYYLGKLAAVFAVTFLVFTVPFYIELILNFLSFPASAAGDPSNINAYDPGYIEGVKNYFLYALYLSSPRLYAVLFIAVFGVISGTFGMFTAALSMIVPVKFKVLLLLPPYALLYGTYLITNALLSPSVSALYFDYLQLMNSSPKSAAAVVLFPAVLAAVSLAAAAKKSGEDCLR